MPTLTSFTPPTIDSFYAAIQRRRLFARMFDEPEDDQQRYEIRAEIGRGGMGVVYEAYQHRLARRVAIKRVRDRSSATAQQQLITEAKTMARIAHPNIVTVYDIEEAEGTLLIVMEYVDGVTLRHWLHHEQPDTDEILAVFLDAAEGLSAAHDKGLIHGDFKPSNVMIDREGRVRVMDFGLARVVEDASSMHAPLRGGTPTYMAPEQLAGAAADERSDQFAFCAALHAALWGRDVSCVVETQPELACIIRRGLHPRPSRRWPSLRALIDALRTELRSAAEPAPHESSTDTSAGARAHEQSSELAAWVRSAALLGLVGSSIALLLLQVGDLAWTPVMFPCLAMFVSRS